MAPCSCGGSPARSGRIASKASATLSTSDMRLIHYSNAPVIIMDGSHRARCQDEHGAMKPNGLWVSDEDEFGWRSWCIEENFRLARD